MTQAAERITDRNGQVWFSKEGDRVSIGFTSTFLETVREAWHVMPTTTGKVTEKSPLLSIETNDRLFSIASPASGQIISFNDRASNFPEKLTEDDVICVIGKPVENKEAPRAVAAPPQNLAATLEMWRDAFPIDGIRATRPVRVRTTNAPEAVEPQLRAQWPELTDGVFEDEENS